MLGRGLDADADADAHTVGDARSDTGRIPGADTCRDGERRHVSPREPPGR
jgi:hypothetical protein